MIRPRITRLFGRIIKLIIWKAEPITKLWDDGGVLYLLLAPILLPINFVISIYNFAGGGLTGVQLVFFAFLFAPIVFPIMIILELVFIIESLFEVRIYGLDYGVDFED